MEEQLSEAVRRLDLPAVRRILQQPPGGGFNVNVNAYKDGWTVLHDAINRDHLAIVQAILQVEGVNVNARVAMRGNLGGDTPLHCSCHAYREGVPIIQALLDAGADPNAVNDNGDTPLFLHVVYLCRISEVEALLDGGANPATRNNNLDTPLHMACRDGRLQGVKLLVERCGVECLTWKNNREETPLDQLVQSQNSSEVKASIRQHILQYYAGLLAQRDGFLCLHSVLQDTAFIDVADDGNDEELFQLAVGKLSTEHLQKLLEYIIALEPGSVRALDRDGMLPLQVASQLNFPDLVINVLLRPYPGALLLF